MKFDLHGADCPSWQNFVVGLDSVVTKDTEMNIFNQLDVKQLRLPKSDLLVQYYCCIEKVEKKG